MTIHVDHRILSREIRYHGPVDEGRERELSTAQTRALQRLARSRRTAPYLARRAEIVLDEDRARSTGAARAAGVSRQTAGKWWRRYRDLGAAGLEDAARPGRPRATQNGTADALLAAPLFANSPGWTSRTLAGIAGCTQSAVARTWKRTFEDGRTALGDALPTGGLDLHACLSSSSGSVLVLRSTPSPQSQPASSAGFMRSALRPALQTILAADVLSRQIEEPKTTPATEFRECVRNAGSAFALCNSPRIAELLHDLEPHLSVIVVDREGWQGLLLDLGPRFSPAAAEPLSAAQRRAMQWAEHRSGSFVWSRDSARIAVLGSRPQQRSRPVPAAATDQIAEAILATLQRDITAGRLGGGDRITETYLARAVHASRGQVREALRSLAFRGILDLQPHRGAVIPTPTVDDVVETYAARRALGAVIVHRAAESPLPGHLPRLERALSTMLETARTGDALATGDDDMRLQEVLAEITGMRRVPRMFSSLTAQLRIFVAVLGMRYGYSIPAMCRDDIELVQLVKDHNAAAAVNRWNTKMIDATTYMIQQLHSAKPHRR